MTAISYDFARKLLFKSSSKVIVISIISSLIKYCVWKNILFVIIKNMKKLTNIARELL